MQLPHAYIVAMPLTVPACALHHCSVSLIIQNFQTALSHTLQSECVGQHAFGDKKGAVTWQFPISPQMFLHTGLRRASTRQLCQPPVRGGWVLPRYSRGPHCPTPISRNFSERFSKIQVYHTQKIS